ncbi:RNA ligase/cyclic nucleotide phosphodiesterase [Metarhizium rileyi]|uniref:RNA ligase/cyclic nucleotide phosphodiesterase n=1 Tax=Metarhizium rileyi (strain RCEF 4871) TaxID=1649241 RepID=A0A167G204_METRR|nr:RNA ligase/cyclic nucleotide phosphodiesterase [Metarhizium rileyi RCEF 4871]TWU79147.1 Ureidoglycolate lyase [Metarhizium rileyi]
MTAKNAENDAGSTLEDLSGIALRPGENPYSAFINACHDDPDEVQLLYSVHRTRRNAQQREKFLVSDFKGLSIDQTILRLERPDVEPGFKDERNCLVFWARPPDHIVRLAARLQDMLRKAAPGIWLMPTHRMHMTVLEVAFSKTPREIGDLVATIRPGIPEIASYTRLHRSRLVKPIISHDVSAFAVSFLPASGEEPLSPPPTAPDAAAVTITQGDKYTYHHLRRDVFDKIQDAGLQVGSRYQVPSAHITLGRFLDEADHDTPEKRELWVKTIDEVNEWLEKEVWDNKDGEYIGEWVVGHEKGLDARTGTLWYGGGRTILLGEGF